MRIIKGDQVIAAKAACRDFSPPHLPVSGEKNLLQFLV
jgi:hypothetical protein